MGENERHQVSSCFCMAAYFALSRAKTVSALRLEPLSTPSFHLHFHREGDTDFFNVRHSIFSSKSFCFLWLVAKIPTDEKGFSPGSFILSISQLLIFPKDLKHLTFIVNFGTMDRSSQENLAAIFFALFPPPDCT
jgi:hypothetical protein